MKIKSKTGIFVSCFGVLMSVILVAFQALTPQPITSGLVILVVNITLLLNNLSRYKKEGKAK